jgi:hypothetical protein
MRVRFWVVLVVALLGCLSFSGRARASGGDLIWPDEATYILIGVPVLTNLAFTGADIALAAQGKHAPRGYAGVELGISTAQLMILTVYFAEADELNPYVVAYAGWTAGLAAHGIVSLVTAPDPTRPKKLARNWDVTAAPMPRGRGGSVSLTGVW